MKIIFNSLLRLLQIALSIAGFFFTGFALGLSVDVGWLPFSVMLMVLGMSFLATCVHEGGHWLGARWGGMTVLEARVFAIDLQPLRHGFRLRWSRGNKGRPLAGYVFAMNRPGKPMRRAELLFIAMGPVMNLLVGGLCLGIGAIFWPHYGVILAFAAMNLAVGVANLVPTFRPTYSDGAHLIRWSRKPDESGPDFAYSRLLALYVSGVDAAQLPVADLQSLARQPMPMPLVALSFQLSILQVAGDWAGALRLDEVLNELLEANPKTLGPCASSIAILRREMDFCRAMLHGNAELLDALLLNRDIDWYSPALAPRCNAVRAALRGDSAEVEHYLDESSKHAINSQVKAYVPFEAAMAVHIRNIMAVADRTETSRMVG